MPHINLVMQITNKRPHLTRLLVCALTVILRAIGGRGADFILPLAERFLVRFCFTEPVFAPKSEWKVLDE